MKWIMFLNGPLAGKLTEVDEPQPNYFAVTEPDVFASFDRATDFTPSPKGLSKRVTYHQIPDTTHPIKYMTNTYDRAQEVVNFVRHLGFRLDDNQERMLRYWFASDVTTKDVEAQDES